MMLFLEKKLYTSLFCHFLSTKCVQEGEYTARRCRHPHIIFPFCSPPCLPLLHLNPEIVCSMQPWGWAGMRKRCFGPRLPTAHWSVWTPMRKILRHRRSGCLHLMAGPRFITAISGNLRSCSCLRLTSSWRILVSVRRTSMIPLVDSPFVSLLPSIFDLIPRRG